MRYIEEKIEKTLGRKVELERDEKGRWKIPQSLIDTAGIDFDGIVHSFEFDDVGEAMRVRESPIPWEVYADKLIFDLEKEEYRKGKALILYPKGFAPNRNETVFLEESRFN